MHAAAPEPSEIPEPLASTDSPASPGGIERTEQPRTIDPGELAVRFTRGDPNALAEAYRRFSPLVYTLSLRTLGQASEAEDVTQWAFVQAWRSRAHYDPDRRPLPAWLVGITRHLVADRTTDEAITARVADAVVVADGLSHLEQPRRRVVEMSFFDGLTHSQISERLGLPLATVKSHVKRGLAQLKTQLEVSDESS